MKKMYLAIFLIVLVVFVFAGCLSFSNTLGMTTTEPEDDASAYEEIDTTQVVVTPNIEETTVSVIPDVHGTTAAQETTTAAQETAEPSSNPAQSPNNQIVAPASSEYDILRNGTFHMIGSMTDKTGETTPMEVAITPDSIYMLSDFSGASMGMLVKDDTVYMVYPEKKAYLVLSDSIMSMAGLNVDELLDSDSINFASYGELTGANSVSEEVYNGRNCKVYHFNVASGESRVYMDGTSLLRLASFDKNGKFVTSTDITSISGSVPADKSAPPSSYKAYKGITGMVSFMTLLGDLIEQ
ncbi:MAG: hypothetical protein IKL10_01625 [Clostridia bacterium]|nr:hypothetical protein [Clostridia bacterium]